MVKITTVENTDELQQIIDLSKKNMVRDLSPGEIQSQGFVTMQYTLDALQQMHSLAPSVVAKDGNNVVGYALVLPPEARSVFPPLEPLFHILGSLNWNNRPVIDYNFYIMGQVCIARSEEHTSELQS